jgi:uncharacterized protein (TIGR03435 family)
VKLADPIRGSNYSATLLALFAVMPLAFAQNAAPIASATTPAKPLAFDVISIRPSKPGPYSMIDTAITPGGYRVTGQSLFYTIMMAYFPQGWYYWSPNRLSGAPSWLDDQYTIDAKVSEADLAEWQKQRGPIDKEPMLSQMLQTMLADRCRLVAHMAPGPPIPGFSLELGKHGPHLVESKPGEVLPDGVRWPDGGIQVLDGTGQRTHLSLYGASMADIAQVLSGTIRRPVQDHTGLTGRYDLVLNWVQDPDSKLPKGFVDPNDPDPLSHWNIDALGLRATPINIPAEALVIDHIERPSEN